MSMRPVRNYVYTIPAEGVLEVLIEHHLDAADVLIEVRLPDGQPMTFFCVDHLDRDRATVGFWHYVQGALGERVLTPPPTGTRVVCVA